MRFAFVRDHAGEFPVAVACRVLGVSRCGYYAWLGRPAPAARRTRKEELMKEVESTHRDSRGLYGSPRVHAELKAAGVGVCENTVASTCARPGSGR